MTAYLTAYRSLSFRALLGGYPKDVERDWEARFSVPTSNDWKAIVFVFALFAIITLPILFPIYIFLLLGLLPAVFVSFVMRRMGRRPLKAIGIAAIAVAFWAALLAWWVIAVGNEPCNPCS